MSAGYVLRRLAVFFLIVWVAATLNFVILRLAPGDPVTGMLSRMGQQGASVSGSDEIISSYRQTFGLDEPLVIQYVKYIVSYARPRLRTVPLQLPDAGQHDHRRGPAVDDRPAGDLDPDRLR